jgi:hypothetical protein
MKRKSFAEEIRDAIRRSGRNCSDLSNAMNTNRSMLYRFMNYETGISTKVLDRFRRFLTCTWWLGWRKGQPASDGGDIPTSRLAIAELGRFGW